MTFSQTLLPDWEEEMKNTRKILERVPDGKNEFRPHEKSMTLGRLATHIAELAGWAKNTLETEVFEIDANFKPHTANSRAEILELFDGNVAEARKRIAAASDADWLKTWTLKFGGQTIMSTPRFAVMRTVCVNHLIHHRAQLGVYLRLNDIEIPGMYGPSADEASFWQKPQTA